MKIIKDRFSLLVKWHRRLKKLAESRGYGFLVTTPEDHKDGFDDGDSLDDELSNLISDCDDDCICKRS